MDEARPFNSHKCQSWKKETQQQNSDPEQFWCKLSNLEVYKCQFCYFKSYLKIAVYRHESDVHGKTRCSDSEIRLRSYICDKCDFESYSLLVFARHACDGSEPEIKWFECAQCPHKTKRKNHLKNHMLKLPGFLYKIPRNKPLTEQELFELLQQDDSEVEYLSEDQDIGWDSDLCFVQEDSQHELLENNIFLNVSDVVEEDTGISEECSSDPLDTSTNAPSTSTDGTTSLRTKIDQYCAQHELTPKSNIIWRKNCTYVTPPIQWYEQKKSQITSLGTPSEYFEKYFTEELFSIMSEMTNLYALQTQASFAPTNVDELRTFVGIHIIMGNLHYPRVRFYWDKQLYVPQIADNMPFNRFSKLRQNLHFVNNEEKDPNNKDRFWKVRPLYDQIRSRCLQLSLESTVCIGEQIIPFKGKLIKQHVKGRPCPWGIKLFALCGRSGLLYDFLLYQGSTTELDKEQQDVFGLGAAVVLKLTERITEKNIQLFYDDYFSNYNLLQWLQNRGIYAAGTARVDRFNKPPFSTDNEMKAKGRGTSEEVLSGDGQVIMTKWFDNKPVIMASNFVSIGNEDTCTRWDKRENKFIGISRPEVIEKYNKCMGGVDKMDSLITLCRTFIKCKKWTMRMFTHAIDISCANSWLEYKNDATELNMPKKEIIDLVHFRAYIAETLIMFNKIPTKRPTKSRSESPASSRPGFPSTSSYTPISKRLREECAPRKEVRLDNVGHLPEFDDKKHASRCKQPNCKSKTHIFCVKCNVHLCIGSKRNCFKSYHTKE